MAVRRTTIEEDVEPQDPKIVRSTKKVINPDIHHPIVEDISVEVNGNTYYTLKGDNNSKPDSEQVSFDQIEYLLVGVLW